MIAKGNSEKHSEAWDEQVDVVIVGAGDAGLAAVIESVDAGATAIVFEKLGSVRSTSSAMSRGTFAFAGTDLQQCRGVQDSNDLFFKDIMNAGKWTNYEPLVKVFLKEQLESYNWLTALGVKWVTLKATGGGSVPRGHSTDPVQHVRILQEAAEKKRAKILFRTRVTELLTDQDKRVIGVCAQSEGQALRVKARKGVVLATGGFGFDTKRMAAIDPRLATIKVVVSPGHTGDGHRMAETLGASFRHMEQHYVQTTIGIHASTGSYKTNLLAYWEGAIVINKRGNRFVNESVENRSIGAATLNQPDQIAYEIFDQKVFDRMQRVGTGIGDAIIKRMVKALTIDDLASTIGVPPQVLKKTIDRYNNGVDKGEDPDFGRTHLVKGVGAMIAIDTPPFYAYETSPWLPGTYGGVAVDENMHVLTNDGIIPGLYGAGEIVGGFHGAGYHGGTALSKAVVFGRIAGRNCAAGQ
jgi:fumarate reductase flavoprotein subunit